MQSRSTFRGSRVEKNIQGGRTQVLANYAKDSSVGQAPSLGPGKLSAIVRGYPVNHGYSRIR